MSRTTSLLMTLLVSITLAAEAYAHTIITRMSDGQNLSLSQLAAVAGNSDLILIGEVHDNKDHHDMQLDLIRSLSTMNRPLAIGLEMIQSNYQQQLDEWVAGRMSETAMNRVFSENWSPDWQMYRDIFIFARDNRIPMVALNVPVEIVRKVSREGFASLTPQERKDLPEGTSCDLKNPQIAFLRKVFKGNHMHANNGKLFSNFCEAQTVRNSGMAINMTRYIKKNPGRKVVVLTGIWHAVKYAIPDQLERYGSKASHTVILPETPEINGKNATQSEVDYLVEM